MQRGVVGLKPLLWVCKAGSHLHFSQRHKPSAMYITPDSSLQGMWIKHLLSPFPHNLVPLWVGTTRSALNQSPVKLTQSKEKMRIRENWHQLPGSEIHSSWVWNVSNIPAGHYNGELCILKTGQEVQIQGARVFFFFFPNRCDENRPPSKESQSELWNIAKPTDATWPLQTP